VTRDGWGRGGILGLRGWLLEVRLRNQVQLIVSMIVVGAANATLGSRITHVPAELFTELAGVPVVYLTPLVAGLSVAAMSTPGYYWFEQTARSAWPSIATAALLVVLGLVGFASPLLRGAPERYALISLRNAVLLGGLALLLRRRVDYLGTCMAVLTCSFAVWTFGWNSESHPYAWALLLAPATDTRSLIAVVGVLSANLLVVRSRWGLRRDG
jgi:hypothetical protein